MKRRIERTADDRFSLPVESIAEGQRLARRLSGTPGCVEAVGGVAVVELQFDLAAVTPERFLEDLGSQIDAACEAARDQKAPAGARLVIPVHYGGSDGPDLRLVSRHLGMSDDEFVAWHCRIEYRVAMLGFTPGFAYLDGLDPALAVPRRSTPRQSVPAGSVGLAGPRCGIYSLPGPGGWQIVGRTNTQLFDRDAERPFRLAPGDTVCFQAADRGRS
ncbi:MAG: 5-oxoprolinase subunit PxpB [Pseudomonadota bacterium]